MDAALDAAREAAAAGDVPVGAAVFALATGDLVAVAANERERRADPTAHAEIVAIREAARVLGRWRLDGHALAVTLEPCTMCAGALVAARVEHLYFGAADPKAGACGSLYQVCDDPRLNHRVDVTWGVREPECAALLSAFFAERRRAGP
ncbi:MAG: nucleoside deaminase [Acidimicrobiia bacterium]|nr:nucleoside deaminase [Acidimicrobiia bacterium]